MVNKKSTRIIAAIVTLSLFLSAAWLSCTKPSDNFRFSCSGVVCSNGGYCDSARCVCPVGYEGAHCERAAVDKFFGSYAMRATITGSDTASFIGRDTIYNVAIRKTATPTTFFLDNFAGDPYYSSIVCTIDSEYSTNFRVDTISRTNMVYDHYRINGGHGVLSGDSILGYVWVRHLDNTSNWQNDTIRLRMHKQ